MCASTACTRNCLIEVVASYSSERGVADFAQPLHVVVAETWVVWSPSSRLARRCVLSCARSDGRTVSTIRRVPTTRKDSSNAGWVLLAVLVVVGALVVPIAAGLLQAAFGVSGASSYLIWLGIVVGLTALATVVLVSRRPTDRRPPP